MLTWRAKRQLFYFGIFAVIAAIILWWIISGLIPEPTCFDGKQNQEEEGIDCGGPCEKKCAGEITDLTVLWSRAVKVKDGHYDVAALIENPNLFAGTKSLSYRFKLYDEKGVTVGIKSGETFVNPGERLVIFEPDIITLERVPVRAVIELDAQKAEWERIEKERPKLIVIKKDFVSGEFPYLQSRIRNDSALAVKNVFATTLLYDRDGNMRAVSSTRIDGISAESETTAVFTWSEPFDFEIETTEVFLRVNQAE